MGQRMPDIPIEYGNDCTIGFPAGQTPKYIYTRFSGMTQCPDWPPVFYTTPPNDRMFTLEQVVGVPCRWVYHGAHWHVQYERTSPPPRTNLFLVNLDDGATYFGDIPFGIWFEGYVFHNDIVACNQVFAAKDGIAVVTWNPLVTALLESINMAKANDLFMELRPLEDGKLVYKFCKLQDATNIAILFEP